MSKKHLFIFLMAIGLTVSSCHTHIFSFVKKKIEGNWIRTPLLDPEDPDFVEIWSFYDENKLSISSSVPDSVTGYSELDPSQLYPDTVNYEILRTFRGHQLFLTMKMPGHLRKSAPTEAVIKQSYITEDSLREDTAYVKYVTDSIYEEFNTLYDLGIYTEKFDIIKLNKRTMYLSLRTQCQECGRGGRDYDLTGGVQMGFVRQ